MPDATPASRSMLGPRGLLALGLALGLIYGYLEAIEVIILGAIPGVLAWRTGNTANVLWFAPLFYAPVGFLAAIPFAVATAVTRRAMDVPLVFVYATVGAFLGASVAEGVISTLAIGILSLGLAAFVTRLYREHAAAITRISTRASLVLALGIPVAAAAVSGARVLRERWAYASLPPAAPRAPNVLLLVLDTQRADHLSTYGYSRATSPNLDAIAAEGVLYENAFAPSSWTLPSHASYFTGRTPQEHRAGVMRRPYLDRAFPTVAEAFQRAGYATGGFVANGYWCGRQTGLDRGFIRYEDFYGSAGDALTRTALGRRIAYDWLPLFGLVDMPGRKRANRINADFLEWVDEREGRPFMAFLNYFDVHGPLLPPPPFEGRYAGKPVRRGRTIELGALTGDIQVMQPEAIRELIDRYDESVLFLDAEIGRLMASLRERGLLDNTILIVTSDHGESFGEHGMMFHGHSMFRDQLHVPLIIRAPGRVAPGTRFKSPVGGERVAATMMELAGVTNHSMAGEPLPLVDSAAGPKTPVVGGVARRSMTGANWPSSRGWITSVVTETYHVIVNEDGTIHVFALPDREERRDLRDSALLADSIRTWRSRFGDAWRTAPEPDRR